MDARRNSSAALHDDGLSDAPYVYASRMKGIYELAEDREGGRACRIILTDERTIGGYEAQADNACTALFALPWFCGHDDVIDTEKNCTPGPTEDVFAWFVAPDGQIVLIDGARQPLFRLTPLSDGIYYERRDDSNGQESLSFSRVSPADADR
ncbi:protease inhibitor Inh/omp19 family protein [Sphingobium sp. CFD-2]|uniref:protease inhibitor Inh/omp19 family protein n=1 Tax=Sphingobium sp. CFD-2 TaxID=2878542 RepID=UPI00214A8E70|nr:protease inhibitor Inh/omp19 family protein [Sphingobium sp. CFD-2]